jgi:hypothetical protein
MSNASDNKIRQLNRQFMQELKGGLLSPLLKKVINDHSLSLEIRNNYINIYYRGGNLLKISCPDEHTYKPFFDDNYVLEKGTLLKDLPTKISSYKNLIDWLDKFPLLKSEMDNWFSKYPKTERAMQQMVMWENNNSSIASSTDYFIIDIEYDNRQGSRFDMVAVQWDSDAIARKLKSKDLPKLCFIEMKYGDAALDGSSGIVEHAKQWKEYLSPSIEDIKTEMLTLFQQKRELELIASLQETRNEIESFSKEVDCIFLIANHDPSSQKLKESIQKLQDIKIPDVEIKFCASNFMGYGLFKENVLKIDEFQKRYEKQIFNG